MKLYYKGTKKEVKEGDALTSFDGKKYFAYYWREPSHGTGKITVTKHIEDSTDCAEYYVSVFNLEWR